MQVWDTAAGRLPEFWQMHACRVDVALKKHRLTKKKKKGLQGYFPFDGYFTFKRQARFASTFDRSQQVMKIVICPP